MGKRLAAAQTQDDIIGRLGGDEFMVACLSTSGTDDEHAQITPLKTRLSACIAGEYRLDNVHIVYPGASLGVIAVDPAETDADSALRVADIAMYQDKKGKSKTGFLMMD